MAGISDEDKQRVREANDIVAVFQEDRPLRQRGRTFWCCCPFHEENTPSCQVDPNTQLFYCFGCHEGGDVISYVMKRDGLDFPDAVRKLADRANIEIAETGGPSLPKGHKARLKQVCAATQEFYHTQLMRLRSPEADEARAYLKGRGFGGDVPKRWGLGFAPGRSALIGHLRQAGFTQAEMIDANVAVSYEGKPARDRFFNRIMFPILDEQGECIAFGGRVVGSGEPKYLNSQDTPLFKKSQVLFGLDKAKASMASSGMAIVVEGYTDVIALAEAGVTNVVATLGTALTRQHIRLLSRHASKSIVYLFDGDEAGQRAAERALGFIGESMTPEAGRNRVELLACTLPDNLDPADFVAERGGEALRAHIETARPLIAFGIDRALSRVDTSTPEGRALAFGDALAILAPIKSSVLAQEYAVQIAGRLHMREQEAIDRLKTLTVQRYDEMDAVRQAPAEPAPALVQSLSKAERNRRSFEADFLALLARYPHLAFSHVEELGRIDWHDPVHAAVAEELLSCLSRDPQATPAQVVAAITQEVPSCARIFVGDVEESHDTPAYAQFLADELAIGDMEEAIATFKAQLAQPQGLPQDEYDSLFSAVSSLQQSLAQRRAAHKKQVF